MRKKKRKVRNATNIIVVNIEKKKQKTHTHLQIE